MPLFSEFSLNQKVKAIKSNIPALEGKVGTIVAFDDKTQLIGVSFPSYEEGISCVSFNRRNDYVEPNSCAMFFPKELEVIFTKTPNSHYLTPIQPIATMRANMSPEAFKGYLRGNIVKYACRFGKKDDELKEAEKLLKYAQWLVETCQDKELTLD